MPRHSGRWRRARPPVPTARPGAPPSADADLVILNTCTVTAAADQDARAAIRRTRRRESECKNRSHRMLRATCARGTGSSARCQLRGRQLTQASTRRHRIAESGVSEGRPQDQEGNDFSRGLDVFMRPASAAGVGDQESRQAFVPLSALIQNSHSPESEAGRRLFVSDIFAHTELLGAPVFEEITAGSHADERTRPNLKVQDGCNNRCSFCVIPYVRGQSRSLLWMKFSAK